VTKIAAEQQCVAALDDADHLHGDLHRGVLGDVLFDLEAPQVQRRTRPANFHESVTVEIVWTVVPFIIVIGMALPATKVLVAQKDTTNADLTIKATGYQWKWGYDYLKGEGEGIGFISTLDSSHRHVRQRQARGPTTTCSRWTTRWWCRWTRRSASSPPPTT
jgi:hypothetical protein